MALYPYMYAALLVWGVVLFPHVAAKDGGDAQKDMSMPQNDTKVHSNHNAMGRNHTGHGDHSSDGHLHQDSPLGPEHAGPGNTDPPSADHSGHVDHSMHAHSGHKNHSIHGHSAHEEHPSNDHSGHKAHSSHGDTKHKEQSNNGHSGHKKHSSHSKHEGHKNNCHSDHLGDQDMEGSSGMGQMMGHGGSMKMNFHTGIENTILFMQWTTSSWPALLGSCLAMFVLAILYEGFKVFREALFSKQMKAKNYKNGINSYGHKCACAALLKETVIQTNPPPRPYPFQKCECMCSRPHILQSLLHVIQVSASFVLMLVVMTFNVYLCLAVVLGAGMGYYLFAWRRSLITDANDHCI